VAGPYVLALDEGSSSARSVLVDAGGSIVHEARSPVAWVRPRPGWVELDPVELWKTQLDTVRRVLAAADVRPGDLAACAVTTHRETVMLWDRRTGAPVHNALVWISSQTDEIVARWRELGYDELFRQRTGLRNDSFFSAAKVAWLLEQVPGVRGRAEAGELACGTVDCWLVWNLTGGRVHATDPSCASRTALFDLGGLVWDEDLCGLLGIPTALLAEVRPTDAEFGRVDAAVLGGDVPITAVVADQQASMYGQACFETGSAKNTFGTAGVLTVNSGPSPVLVDGLTSSVGWTGRSGTAYELEGVVFHSGQTLQWLRDGLGLLTADDDVEAVARSVPNTGGVYFVPGFGGLCAPYWDRRARASCVGMTLETTKAHVVRAAVESMAYQTVDIVEALSRGGLPVTDLKVDGGAARNDLLCQLLADLTGLQIHRPRELERTALGAAYLAGTAVGLWSGPEDVSAGWLLDRSFDPQLDAGRRAELHAGWLDAVHRTLTAPPERSSSPGPPYSLAADPAGAPAL
jgi:glycerol kinase